jgi:Tol biopolymer transport system component/DNA-binding winged helix-turn-helix (wHTH) protein
MDDSVTRGRKGEIVLADEPSFALAGCFVRPAALEVECDGVVTGLEPRVMQVLVALHQCRGEPVSRDALIDSCWGGRIVTEGALNRCVGQVRKALSADPQVRIETIPKIGYRLRVEKPKDALDPVLETPLPSVPAFRIPWRSFITPAVILIVALAWYITKDPGDVTWSATSYRPLTTDPGLETWPALSPTGAQLIYAHHPDPYSQSDLYLRNLSQGPPLQLTANKGDDYAAAWSPSADRIVFTRSARGGPCALIILPIPRGPERQITRCETAYQTRASWLDDHTLVFADTPISMTLPRIRAVDIETGATRDLTAPPSNTLGDAEPVVSPNGKRIAFRRMRIPGSDDLFMLDATTGRERALTSDGWKAAGYVWSNDSRYVFMSSNRGGEFGLWSVDSEREHMPRQVSLGLGTLSFTHMSLDKRNQLAVELARGQLTLARVSLDGVIAPVTTGTGSDYNANVASDGTIVYISARSGSDQVWITQPTGESARLTSLPVSYSQNPVWSRDAQTIAFIAIGGHQSRLYTIARDGSQLRKVTADSTEKRDPVYGADGKSLFYVARSGSTWRLMEVSLETNNAQPRPVPGGDGWKALRSDGAGRLYGQRGTAIVALDPRAPIVDVGLTDIDVWAASPRGLYVRRGRTPERPSTIWFYPWNGTPRKLADIPLASSSIAVDSAGAVIFSQSPDYQIDLGLVDLHSAS